MNSLTIRELKIICKNNNIKKYCRYRKDDLVKYIESFKLNNENEVNELLKKKSLNSKTTTKYKNNESLGITCEYIICNLYGLDNDLEDRIITRNLDKLTNKFTEFKTQFENEFKQSVIGFNGFQNDSVDFFCNNDKTLSVKSNFKKSGKVCPQKIGQPTKKSFLKHMKQVDEFKELDIEPTSTDIKSFIFNNINVLIKQYYKYLFCCDYTLWIYGDKHDTHNYKIIDKQSIIYPFIENKFTFSKTLEQWNEGITLRYNDVSIGEFQFHNNRDCIKFRFYINKILEL